MNWIETFENTFDIIPTSQRHYKVIIGKQPYLQRLNIDLRVNRTAELNSMYTNFNEVAFLVNNWIKIQDSLEMVFNLFSHDSKKSLKILSYLREKEIPVIEFANYLVTKHNLILVNRRSEDDNETHINHLIFSLAMLGKVSILFVGKNSFKPNNDSNSDGPLFPVFIGDIIHPSGVNLNKLPDKYFKTWYEFNQESVSRPYPNIGVTLLSDFHVFRTR